MEIFFRLGWEFRKRGGYIWKLYWRQKNPEKDEIMERIVGPLAQSLFPLNIV